MKLSKEQIAKVFAMYLGCTIQHEDDQFAELIGVVNVDAHFIHEETGSYGFKDVRFAGKLLLTPLSEITDEHAVMMYHLYCGIIAKYDYTMDFHGLLKAAILWLTKGGLDEISKYTVTCELAKKLCYAVPLFFEPNHWANGKTAIELGIAISKNEVK